MHLYGYGLAKPHPGVDDAWDMEEEEAVWIDESGARKALDVKRKRAYDYWHDVIVVKVYLERA